MRIVSTGRRAWNVRRSFSRRSASQRNSWRAHQHLSTQSDFGCGDEDSPSMRRELRVACAETGSGGHFPMEPLVGWPTLGCQEEGLQGVVGGTSLEERVDQARSRRRPGGDGSRKLVRVEGSDPRPHEAAGAQCRGGGRGQEGCGGACEQVPHGQEETSLPRWITSCRDLDDAPPRLSEFVARRSGHRPEEEN